MSTDSEFLAHARDLFADLGPIRTGRLFGGTALYVDDAMFAVIFGDALYMKADKPLAAEYADAGSVPFQYDTKTGVRIIPGLISLPESALDDPDEAMFWARKSMVPARKAATKRTKAKQAKK
ncbi:TfoX/Sxy family protein [Profundibacter sp.]|uniref:TfoX/Sxy family protein n=1 Tax=Profundibacter sp. TaxID=3101071 RepID=UPI003D132F9D